MVLREELDAVEREDPCFGLGQRLVVDVGGVEQRALLQAFFPEQDGEGIHLLAAAAAGHPDLERRVGAQMRHHFSRIARK